MDRMEAIRNAERESHTQAYTSYTLFEQGTWLAKPVRTVMEILPLFENTGEGFGIFAIRSNSSFATPCRQLGQHDCGEYQDAA